MKMKIRMKMSITDFKRESLESQRKNGYFAIERKKKRERKRENQKVKERKKVREREERERERVGVYV